MRSPRAIRFAAFLFLAAACRAAPGNPPAAQQDEMVGDNRLPTGAALDPAGESFAVGDFPLALAQAPGDSDRAVLLLSGWRDQGIVVVDPVRRRVLQRLEQPSAFLGLAFSPDGRSLWSSGGNQDVIYRYTWNNGAAALADSVILAPHYPDSNGVRYPAGLAFSPDGSRLYVAENLADTLAVVDPATGTVVQRLAAGSYPYDVAVAPDGRVYVSVWGGFEVRSYLPRSGQLVPGPVIRVPRHPSDLLLNGDGSRLFVTSGSTDRIGVVDTRAGRTIAELRDPAPDGPSEGSTPNGLALAPEGTRLFVAEADNNAVAVFDLSAATAGVDQATSPTDHLAGRIPVQWYPTAVSLRSDTLLVVNAKGSAPGPNTEHPQGPGWAGNDPAGYTLGQLEGTLSLVPEAAASPERLADLSRRVERANRWSRPAPSSLPPIEHVVYIIKENRTYDQVFGDIPQGDGDTALVFFPRAISPNHHALAERFGLYDRFFVNAEVSADGHNWSTAAYATDYLEKTVRLNYSDQGRSYDYEGENRDVEVSDEDDVAAPNGYLWDLAEAKGITYRNYGEFVAPDQADSVTQKGWHGAGPNGRYHGVKQALRGHTDSLFPGFDLDISDQVRADRWLAEFQEDVRRGTMPQFEIVRLPNDHTRGADAGAPTPKAYMADNDLALGRIIEALSRSPFWKSTAVFVVEDDAQDGTDHVDSHRSLLLVISPWTRRGVIHRFVNTTDVLATMEALLGLDQLSQFDFYGRPLRHIWASEPDLAPYAALTPAQSLTEKNPPHGPGAVESSRLDFRQEDRADEASFNHVLWVAIKGPDVPEPKPVRMGAAEWVRGR